MAKFFDLVELRFTLGNLSSIVVTVAAGTMLYASLNTKVDEVARIVDVVPALVKQVDALQYRADTGRTAREKLEERVDGLEVGIGDIKTFLGRIEERLIYLQKKS